MDKRIADIVETYRSGWIHFWESTPNWPLGGSSRIDFWTQIPREEIWRTRAGAWRLALEAGLMTQDEYEERMLEVP